MRKILTNVFNFVCYWEWPLTTLGLSGALVVTMTVEMLPDQPAGIGSALLWIGQLIVPCFLLFSILLALFLRPLTYRVIAWRNGAPFAVGDLVEILGGADKGRRTEIYEIWPTRGEVRTQLGPERRAAVTDVYSETQVARCKAL